MIPWIQVYSNLPQHPKTTRLADELGLASTALSPNAMAVGLVVSLWTWAIQNAYDGDLSGCSQRAIADACMWRKKPDVLVKALMKAGFLDADMKLHDWDEHACLLVEQEENRKAKTRDRVKRYRDKKAALAERDSNASCNAPCNVTDTPCNASTTPNITNISGGGGVLSAREAVGDFCTTRSLSLGDFLGMTETLRDEVSQLTDELFRRFVGRTPIEGDEVNVYLCSHKADKNGSIAIDRDKRDLLCYAFEAAATVGKHGDWNYIRGILRNMQQRGIETLADAEDYDDSRRS